MTKTLLFVIHICLGLQVFLQTATTSDLSSLHVIDDRAYFIKNTQESKTIAMGTFNCAYLTTPMDQANDVAIDINLSWNSVSGASGYFLTVGTTSGGNDILDYEDVGMLTSFNLSDDLPSNTTIYVNITPYDAQGNITGCTEESFTTGSFTSGIVPSCTAIYNPENGQTDVPINTGLNWNEVLEADSYRLSLGTTPGGTDILDNQDVGRNSEFRLGIEFPMGRTIYVNIIPYNSHGDAVGCMEHFFTTISEIISDDKSKYGFSPDGDGINDFWVIEDIESHPDNTVFIYNRWGDLVFQIEGYDNASNVFRGEANKLTKLGAGNLPEGTYFFRIEILGETGIKKLKGFLVLKR